LPRWSGTLMNRSGEIVCEEKPNLRSAEIVNIPYGEGIA